MNFDVIFRIYTYINVILTVYILCLITKIACMYFCFNAIIVFCTHDDDLYYKRLLLIKSWLNRIESIFICL